MLRIILLSLVLAICSTCLVRPWFWNGIFKKQLFNDGDGKRIGFNKTFWKIEVIIESIIFVVTFGSSMVWYGLVGSKQDLCGSVPIIIVCLMAQMVWINQGKVRKAIIFGLGIMMLALGIQDAVSSYIDIPTNPTITMESYDDINLSIPADGVESLLKSGSISISEPTYNNGKYIFKVKGNSTYSEKMVAVITTDSNTTRWCPCSYTFSVNSVREQYPYSEIKKQCIAVSDEDVPYEIYAKADKDWLSGRYQINGYFMFNMQTGELQEIDVNELPNFARND